MELDEVLFCSAIKYSLFEYIINGFVLLGYGCNCDGKRNIPGRDFL